MANKSGLSSVPSTSSLLSVGQQSEIPGKRLSQSAPPSLQKTATFQEKRRSLSEGGAVSVMTPSPSPGRLQAFFSRLFHPVSPVPSPPLRNLQTPEGVRDFMLNGAQCTDGDPNRFDRELDSFQANLVGCDIAFMHHLLGCPLDNVLGSLLANSSKDPGHIQLCLSLVVNRITAGFPGVSDDDAMVKNIKKSLRDAMAVCTADDTARRSMLRNAVMQLSFGQSEALDRFLLYIWDGGFVPDGHNAYNSMLSRVNVVLSADLINEKLPNQWTACDATWLDHDAATMVVLAIAKQLFDVYPDLREQVRPETHVARDGRWPEIAQACINALKSDRSMGAESRSQLIIIFRSIADDYKMSQSPHHKEIAALMTYLRDHELVLRTYIEMIQAK